MKMEGFDAKQFIDAMLLNDLKKKDKKMYKVVKVFIKYGISFMDALAIMTECSLIYSDEGEDETDGQ